MNKDWVKHENKTQNSVITQFKKKSGYFKKLRKTRCQLLNTRSAESISSGGPPQNDVNNKKDVW